MSEKLQAVRGTQDLLADECRRFRWLDETAWEIARRFGYEEIRTPIFEFSEVFHRTLGETSDMVAKETYTFADRGGDLITLRPEGTAGIARAFISNGLAQLLPLKYYYFGPMFRYERPQKGRHRQFHQIGVESLGAEDPLADVECISLAHLMLKEFGLEGRVKLEINFLGDAESRSRHREKLVSYLSGFRSELSPDSQVRLEKNPLRILDSKEAQDREILENAPRLSDFLNPFSKQFAEGVLAGLSGLGIPYVANENLVRGIDYYTHTVFEFTCPELGAQSAVLAGGRYNGLIQLMGGHETPGVGFAAGVERLALLLSSDRVESRATLIAVMAVDESTEAACAKLTFDLRQEGAFTSEHLRGANLGKKMKRAAKLGARFAIILGSDEVRNNQVTVKVMTTGGQKTILADDLRQFLRDSSV
ncbi:MAG: histidine--tRNA ligase [Bdellovibrio sp.]|nr:MAG: histidine--tRNA ligase [Bdellovibrio sp.]